MMQNIKAIIEQHRPPLTDEKVTQAAIANAHISGAGEHAAFVYGIRFTKDGHPHTGLIRYVGKSTNPARRFGRHLRENSQSRIHRAVIKHGAGCFSLELLEQCNGETRLAADAAALAREIHWIDALRTARDRHGLNSTKGGEGTVLTDEVRELHAPRRRKMLNEIKSRPEILEKMRSLAKSRAQEPTYGAHRAAILKRVWESPQYRANHSEAARKWHSDPENQKKHAERVRRQSQRPEIREMLVANLRAVNSNPAVRAKIRATQKRMFAENPALVEAKAETARALHQDPTYRAKRDAGIKAKLEDPVYMAERIALTKGRHSESPAFVRSAKIGIHLHWHKSHAANGKLEAAAKQLSSLRSHLAEALKAGEASKIIVQATAYLSLIDGAAK
ncbi:GIY-YIG nuclease family protein [Paraburkholderia aspalathi]|uniref:GIY-YIG nuclease family protein n=1 Tax=Paraburkholderia aspalathi TaxID=1324617 RepID=UPI0038B6C25E